MPTKARAACADLVGASNRSDPLVRSSLRIAKLSLKKAPIVPPIRTMTSASVITTATVASEYFRAAVSRSFPLVPLPRAIGCFDLRHKVIRRSGLFLRYAYTHIVNL
jgi:hypothetical protein